MNRNWIDFFHLVIVFAFLGAIAGGMLGVILGSLLDLARSSSGAMAGFGVVFGGIGSLWSVLANWRKVLDGSTAAHEQKE